MTFKKLKPKTPAPDRPLPDVPTVRTRGKAIHSQEQAQEIEQQRKQQIESKEFALDLKARGRQQKDLESDVIDEMEQDMVEEKKKHKGPDFDL